MTILGEKTEQLDIFCRITGFTSDFLSFMDVELIRFFHRAIQFTYLLTYLLNHCRQVIDHWREQDQDLLLLGAKSSYKEQKIQRTKFPWTFRCLGTSVLRNFHSYGPFVSWNFSLLKKEAVKENLHPSDIVMETPGHFSHYLIT